MHDFFLPPHKWLLCEDDAGVVHFSLLFLGPFSFHSNHGIISGWQPQALIFCSCQRTVVTHGTITYVLYDFERLAASFEQREQSNSNHCFKKCGWWKFTSAFLFYTIKTEWCVLSCVPRHGFLRLLQQTKAMELQNVWMWIVRIKILYSDRDRNLQPKYRKKQNGFDRILWRFYVHPLPQSRDKKESFILLGWNCKQKQFLTRFRMSVGQLEVPYRC